MFFIFLAYFTLYNGLQFRPEGGLGWGTHVNPWLFHFNVWQNPPKIKKKRKEKKKRKHKYKRNLSETDPEYASKFNERNNLTTMRVISYFTRYFWFPSEAYGKVPFLPCGVRCGHVTCLTNDRWVDMVSALLSFSPNSDQYLPRWWLQKKLRSYREDSAGT